MAGHSKWANIRFRKGAQDAKRGKIFTKLIREIKVAARIGGVDISNNPRLREAISKALKANMKRDSIDHCIKKSSMDATNENYIDVSYEGYGPYGVAILVDCLTDNKQRTVSDVRHILTKNGGNLGTDGSVKYLFKDSSYVVVSKEYNEDQIINIIINYNNADLDDTNDDSYIISLNTNDLHRLLDQCKQSNINIIECDSNMIADTNIELNIEQSHCIRKILDLLEDLDDVQKVYSNAAFIQ